MFILHLLCFKVADGTAEVIEPLLPSDDPPPFTLTVANEGLVYFNLNQKLLKRLGSLQNISFRFKY
jgi:hypothetical protein